MKVKAVDDGLAVKLKLGDLIVLEKALRLLIAHESTMMFERMTAEQMLSKIWRAKYGGEDTEGTSEAQREL